MIETLFWSVLGASAAAVVAILTRLRRGSGVSPWDIALVFVPGMIWFALAISGFRLKSLSNLAEFFALFPITAGLLAVRWKLSSAAAPAIFGCGVLAALLLYVFVPVLPE